SYNLVNLYIEWKIKIKENLLNFFKLRKLKLKYLYILTVLLFSNTFFAQNIQGVVKNVNGNVLSNVSVILKTGENKTVAYQFTKTNGSFSFTELEIKEYTLQCNALGYEKQLVTVDLLAEKSKELTITLQEMTEALKGIGIEIPVAMRQQNHTVACYVKALLDETEYTVEDLLKKLPALQVTDNRTVKVGNQKIDQIM